MKEIFKIILLIFVGTFCLGKTNIDSLKKKNYCPECPTCGCTLKPDDPAHFDPYYNGHLCENFNPKQNDFSKEYFDLRTKSFSKDTNKLQESRKYDFSPIWLTSDWEQNGVLGLNYKRIQFHIDKVLKNSKNSDTYLVFGKSKVNDNICNFKGEIKLVKVFLNYIIKPDVPIEHETYGELFASYVFFEDSAQQHSGIFKGITECSFYLDSTRTQMQVDETNSDADGYWNRSFVGTWKDYRTNMTKKCIWGDYRLPFTFDFDTGDGEMMVDEKYIKNGWQTFHHESEYNILPNDKVELKNKWWLIVKK